MHPLASCANTLDPQDVLSAANNTKENNFVANRLKKTSRRINSELPMEISGKLDQKTKETDTQSPATERHYAQQSMKKRDISAHYRISLLGEMEDHIRSRSIPIRLQ
jgi:hypothetical protein